MQIEPIICPHCQTILIKAKKEKLKLKDLKKQYFYTQFLKCPNCDYIKFDNSYKIEVGQDVRNLIKPSPTLFNQLYE